MIDLNRPDAVRSDDVLRALEELGFACCVVDQHAIATRDATRLVVPAPGRTLPDTFVLRLEHSLESILGTGWLTRRRPPSTPLTTTRCSETGDVVVLDAVVDQCPDSYEWCAFLPEQLTVMGTATTRIGALRDLKAATALWLGIGESQLVFITPDVV